MLWYPTSSGVHVIGWGVGMEMLLRLDNEGVWSADKAFGVRIG